MAFTYDLSSNNSDILTISKIRLLLGDKFEGMGMLPDNHNFMDDEILSFYEEEGDHLQRATARGLEAAANAWAAYAGEHELGPENEVFKQSQAFAERAADLRLVFGETPDQKPTKKGVISVGAKRDGT